MSPARPDPGSDRLRGIPPRVADRHWRALVRERPADRRADPAATTGDNGHLSLQLHGLRVSGPRVPRGRGSSLVACLSTPRRQFNLSKRRGPMRPPSGHSQNSSASSSPYCTTTSLDNRSAQDGHRALPCRRVHRPAPPACPFRHGLLPPFRLSSEISNAKNRIRIRIRIRYKLVQARENCQRSDRIRKTSPSPRQSTRVVPWHLDCPVAAAVNVESGFFDDGPGARCNALTACRARDRVEPSSPGFSATVCSAGSGPRASGSARSCVPPGSA